jgi:LmbE family N-acetylglucosaminyl deacetylase
MVVLAVGAHPDDVEFGCFGTLARMASSEKICLLVLTRGEITARATLRVSESRKSASMLGAAIRILPHPDGELRQTGETVREVRNEIKRTGASTVFCPHINDTHQDHVAAGKIVMSSWKYVNRILLYETPTTTDFQPNVYCDITKTFGLKRRALELFESQGARPYLDTSQVRGLAEYRAWQCNRSKALFEAFVLGRAVLDQGGE